MVFFEAISYTEINIILYIYSYLDFNLFFSFFWLVINDTPFFSFFIRLKLDKRREIFIDKSLWMFSLLPIDFACWLVISLISWSLKSPNWFYFQKTSKFQEGNEWKTLKRWDIYRKLKIHMCVYIYCLLKKNLKTHILCRLQRINIQIRRIRER